MAVAFKRRLSCAARPPVTRWWGVRPARRACGAAPGGCGPRDRVAGRHPPLRVVLGHRAVVVSVVGETGGFGPRSAAVTGGVAHAAELVGGPLGPLPKGGLGEPSLPAAGPDLVLSALSPRGRVPGRAADTLAAQWRGSLSPVSRRHRRRVRLGVGSLPPCPGPAGKRGLGQRSCVSLCPGPFRWSSSANWTNPECTFYGACCTCC